MAAINGPAVAGGFAVALLCDMRLASTEARMGFLENRRGIPPSYAAARAALPAALAADLCLTGRLLEAEEAQRLGVVTEVHAPDDLMPRARELAAEIAAAPPSASIETKRRILIERATCWRPLFEAEEQALRDALLGPPSGRAPPLHAVCPARLRPAKSRALARDLRDGTSARADVARRSVPPLQSGQRFKNRLRRRSIP